MESFGKIVKLILALCGVGAISYFAVKEYKKAVKRDEKEEKEFEKTLNDVGISKKRFEKEMIPGEDDNNLVKALLLSIDSDPKWDIDSFYIDENNELLRSENVIHLRQQTDARGDEKFDLLFEIPFKPGNYNYPQLRDFIIGINEYKKYLEENEGFEIRTKLEGYFLIIKDGNVSMASIPAEYYSKFATDNNDGLGNYVKHLKKVGVKEVNLPDGMKVMSAKLLYKLSFNRNDLTIAKAKEILDDIINKEDYLVIGNDDNTEVRYDGVIFNTKDSSGYWSLINCYDLDEKNNIFVNSYAYEDLARSKGLLK